MNDIEATFFDIHIDDPTPFTQDAIDILKQLAENLEIHAAIVEHIEHLEPSENEQLDRIFEQKLATYISITITTIVTYDNVVTRVNKLLHDIINEGISQFVSDSGIPHMLNGYPIGILAAVCNTHKKNVHIMGESVKHFINFRKSFPTWLPCNLELATIGGTPLIGDINSPLDKLELEAIYDYLGSRKNIYVHILLNCLFELAGQDEYSYTMLSTPVIAANIITVCKSSWLYLFLFAVGQNK